MNCKKMSWHGNDFCITGASQGDTTSQCGFPTKRASNVDNVLFVASKETSYVVSEEAFEKKNQIASDLRHPDAWVTSL